MEDRTLTTRVILVRHGQSSYNLERRIQGRLDASTLTDLGRAAAQKVAEAFTDLSFDAVYTSPLQRAKTTAETICDRLRSLEISVPELQPRDDLQEVDLPLWQGMLSAEVKEKFPEDYRCWRDRPHEFKMVLPGPDGPTEHYPVPSLYEQAKQFWADILPRHSGQTILIVGHNGINRALISTAIGLAPDFYQRIRQSNCGISVLNFPSGWGTAAQLESLNLTSHLGEALPDALKTHQGPRLLLVRHGETEWNRQKRFQGQIDVPLNENGQAQAQRAAEFLQDVALDFAVSSPMLRPKATAEAILARHAAIALELEDGLREISHGLWEGKLESEIETEFPGQLEQWKTAPETVQMPEGENLQEVWDRTIATWEAIVRRKADPTHQTGMVVAHDAVNKAILCHVLGLGAKDFWQCKQGNGAVSVIDYPDGPDGPPVLQAMNITTHLSGSVLDKTAAGAL